MMRKVKAVLLASFCTSVLAASQTASVYFLDQIERLSLQESSVPAVEPSTARLLLAQRLGISQYHSFENLDDTSLQLLNRFRDTRSSLFDEVENNVGQHKTLIIVEGVNNANELINNAQQPAFTIPNPPSSSSNIQLVADFLVQDRHQRASKEQNLFVLPSAEVESISGGFSGRDTYGTSYCFNTPIPLSTAKAYNSDGLDILIRSRRHHHAPSYFEEATALFHVSTLESVAQYSGIDSTAYRQTIENLKAIIEDLTKDSVNSQVTLVLVPSTSSSTKGSPKGYGTYRVPTSPLKRRSAQAEEPLSMVGLPEVSPSVSQDSSASQPHAFQKSPKRKATMKICHSSLDACISATDNCSGHGSCYEKNATKGDGDDNSRACWACGCDRNGTTRTNADGTKKTTYWGGPACSKQDVSAPFFLLAGFTIAMLAAISWGVGLMYSIGQEPLPSVIGAGVAGPRASK